ncbi:MAG: hypothetical protein M1823_002578 [Watsoniomyces obsoletus]|nr:MAG: hypothetical protein M1823_002578 [Watsoniomyces obsoletus]
MDGDREGWTVKSNNAVQVRMVRAGREPRQTQVVGVFSPKHTYEIFGENEEIIGYRDLRIVLQYACFDLYPHVEIDWREKHERIKEGGERDVMTIMKKWLPAIAFHPKTKLIDHLEEHRTGEWTPPGRRLATYRDRGRTFEIWCGQLSEQKMWTLLDQMQIFVTFFIEGGSYVNMVEPEWTLQRWSVFLLYERTNTKISQPPYELVGYCTTYRFWNFVPPMHKPTIHSIDDPLFPDQVSSVRALPCRERISQFVILPPNQRQGHGARFYQIMVDAFVRDPSVREITVEDPNEAFDDLRDYCDLVRLRQNPAFSSLAIDTSVQLPPNGGRLPTSKLLPLPTLENLRTAHKLAQRQFDRLVEMQLLSVVLPRVQQVFYRDRINLGRNASTATKEERHYFLWRLLVKQRLYKRNLDVLAQIDLPERKIRLEAAMQDQERDYIRLLDGVVKWQASREKQLEELRAKGHTSMPPLKQGVKRGVATDENNPSNQVAKKKSSDIKIHQGEKEETGTVKGKFGDEDRVGEVNKNGEGEISAAEDPATLSSSAAKRIKYSHDDNKDEEGPFAENPPNIPSPSP